MNQQQIDIADLKERIDHIMWRLERIEGFLTSFPKETEDVTEPPVPDELFVDVAKKAGEFDKVSATKIQRWFGIGYARASIILDQLAEAQLVSSFDGTAKPRKVYKDKIQAYLEENGGGDNKVAL